MMHDEVSYTTTQPKFRIIGLSCGNCDFHYELQDKLQYPIVPRDYLHDWTWIHKDCNGQISWLTEEDKFSLDLMIAVFNVLQSGITPVMGFPASVLNQLERHRIEG